MKFLKWKKKIINISQIRFKIPNSDPNSINRDHPDSDYIDIQTEFLLMDLNPIQIGSNPLPDILLTNSIYEINAVF